MVQRYEQMRRLQWYKRGAAYKYGFCLPEWSMHDFDLFEDLMFFKNEESVFGLCFSASYCFERLTRQLDKWQLNILLNLLAELKNRLKISIFLWRKSCASR